MRGKCDNLISVSVLLHVEVLPHTVTVECEHSISLWLTCCVYGAILVNIYNTI